MPMNQTLRKSIHGGSYMQIEIPKISSVETLLAKEFVTDNCQ